MGVGRSGVLPAPAAHGVALAGAVLAGVLTSVGQGGAPVLASLANSAGPWFVVAVGLLLLVRPRLGWALPLGVLLLELMHVGYWAATNLRGVPDALSITNTWVLLGVPAGLLAGAVAVGVRSADGRRRGAALGVTAAILAGEGVRALLTVVATTGATYWTAEVIVGVLVLVVGLLVARSAVGRVLALAAAVVGTAGVLVAYAALGSLG